MGIPHKGYSRMSLRDKGLDRFREYSLGSNPSDIGHSCPLRATFDTPADKNVRDPIQNCWVKGLLDRAHAEEGLWSKWSKPTPRRRCLA